MTEIVKRNDTYRLATRLARPPILTRASPTRAAPASWASLLSCRKGDWGIGRTRHPRPPVRCYLFIVPTA